jgi:hypothetical protein
MAPDDGDGVVFRHPIHRHLLKPQVSHSPPGGLTVTLQMQSDQPVIGLSSEIPKMEKVEILQHPTPTKKPANVY